MYSFSLAYNRACSASGIPGNLGFAISESSYTSNILILFEEGKCF
ncbi:hypothetical protein M066_4030 [Bacteroides fragilis str. I1345]|uniref:Uncharacterized protein n=1 Tax=Bacteroides fragilis str. 3976T8 TaxID=1339314 RepID=A0A016E2X8_BACFG|nr:hypothetical protein M118_3610 [Bacteroides fragilis str. 3783N1-2]EXY78775.1 hypothetical protein M084_3510 [Bacteroides fragilis str. 3988 T1]EXZ08441.1 hypothetical protein M073_3614 [Bacteroides fragilis str. DS-71]EXZ17704.1 hypothetical protein M067_3923 [Bacteroides fragilis str. J-143-4]EXZ71521.1 hypothetical protein M123_4080 [Bacteroides fragilis str. 3976T8]EXZ87551.1 hypothetical protein M068_3872 [Bacteroides fragilis str. J38-1]EXZ98709.1 hypothetical protein M087_3675 [Bact